MVSVGRTRQNGLNKGPFWQWISFSRKFSPAAGDWPKSACINSILSPFFFSYSYKSSCCYNILIYGRASMYKHLVITELLSKVTTFWKHHNFSSLMHQSIPPNPPSSPPPPPPQPRAIAGHLPTLSVPGVGHLQISGICQPWGYSQAFKTHAVSYLNITTNTRAFYWKNKHTGLIIIVKDRKKLKRVVKTCSCCDDFNKIYSFLVW